MSLESTGEIKLIMKFNLCLHNFSEFQVRIYQPRSQCLSSYRPLELQGTVR